MKPHELNRLQKLLTFEDPRLPQMFSALGDDNRCRIFRLLHTQASASFCVSDIAKVLKVTTPTASHHLKVLETAGLLTRVRSGQEVFYKINDEDQLVKIIRKAIS